MKSEGHAQGPWRTVQVEEPRVSHPEANKTMIPRLPAEPDEVALGRLGQRGPRLAPCQPTEHRRRSGLAMLLLP